MLLFFAPPPTTVTIIQRKPKSNCSAWVPRYVLTAVRPVPYLLDVFLQSDYDRGL